MSTKPSTLAEFIGSFVCFTIIFVVIAGWFLDILLLLTSPFT